MVKCKDCWYLACGGKKHQEWEWCTADPKNPDVDSSKERECDKFGSEVLTWQEIRNMKVLDMRFMP